MMLKVPSPLVLRLQRGDLLPLSGVLLCVQFGRVWVTQAGDPEDHVLDGGDSMAIAAGAQALVGAEGPVQLALVDQPPGLVGLVRVGLRRLAALCSSRRLACDLDFSLAK